MSDQTTDIFAGDNQDPAKETQNPSNTAPSQVFDLPEEVAPLVGDGRKYADVATALKSIPHAQGHIGNLENENKLLQDKISQLETDLAARKSVEEVLRDVQSHNPQSTPSASLTTDDIASLIEAKFSEQSKVAVAKQNLAKVSDTLTEQFGGAAAAAQALQEKAKALGVAPKFLKDMAQHSPDAVLAYFKEAKPAPRITQSVNADALVPEKKQYNTSDRKALWKEIKQSTYSKHGIQEG